MKENSIYEKKFLNLVPTMTATIATELVLQKSEEDEREKQKSIFSEGECIVYGGIEITDCGKGVNLSLFEHSEDEEFEKTKKYNLHKMDTMIDTMVKFKKDYLNMLEEYKKEIGK